MAVGINCTKPELITNLLQSAKAEIPYIVYPNAGKVWDAEVKEWLGVSTTGFAANLVDEWNNLGATIIGGCCGIGAKEISEM
jgi:homocysteine S-methyltransferase